MRYYIHRTSPSKEILEVNFHKSAHIPHRGISWQNYIQNLTHSSDHTHSPNSLKWQNIFYRNSDITDFKITCLQYLDEHLAFPKQFTNVSFPHSVLIQLVLLAFIRCPVRPCNFSLGFKTTHLSQWKVNTLKT